MEFCCSVAVDTHIRHRGQSAVEDIAVRSHTRVADPHHDRSLAIGKRPGLNAGLGGRRQRMHEEGIHEGFVTERLALKEVITASYLGPACGVGVVSDGHTVVVEAHAGGLIAVGISDDLPGLSELRGRKIALVKELGHIGVEVIVAMANAATGVEGQIDLDELAREGGLTSFGLALPGGFGGWIEVNLDRLDKVYLGAVRTRDGGHLLDAERRERIDERKMKQHAWSKIYQLTHQPHMGAPGTFST